MAAAKYVMHVTMRWGHGVGGVKRFIHDAIEALPKDGYRQVVASLGPITGDSQGLMVFGPIVQDGSLAGNCGMRDMVNFFEEKSPDVVHIHCNNGVGLLCAEAARRAGRVVRVVHSHNSSLGSDELWKRAGNSALKLLFSRAPTARIACSAIAGKWLFDKKPYLIVKNGIDLERFVFSPELRMVMREELGIPVSAFVFGLVGAGIPVKNASFALEVLARLREEGVDARLILIGEGEESAMLVGQAARLGISPWVHFTGTVIDVWRYYCAMDCLVMPSFYEGLPISLIEAQANGLPCVVSETVSREVNVTGSVTFLSLSTTVQAWARTVLLSGGSEGRLEASRSLSSISALRTAGFSMAALRRQLESVYGGGDLS